MREQVTLDGSRILLSSTQEIGSGVLWDGNLYLDLANNLSRFGPNLPTAAQTTQVCTRDPRDYHLRR